MPVKKKEDVVEKEKFHQIIRQISKVNAPNLGTLESPLGDIWSAGQVDEYISQWLNDGYKLVSVEYLVDTTEAFFMYYALELVV